MNRDLHPRDRGSPNSLRPSGLGRVVLGALGLVSGITDSERRDAEFLRLLLLACVFIPLSFYECGVPVERARPAYTFTGGNK